MLGVETASVWIFTWELLCLDVAGCQTTFYFGESGAVPSWSGNWTVYQSVSPARSWLFLAVRAGEHNFLNHHHHHHHPSYYTRVRIIIEILRYSRTSANLRSLKTELLIIMWLCLRYHIKHHVLVVFLLALTCSTVPGHRLFEDARSHLHHVVSRLLCHRGLLVLKWGLLWLPGSGRLEAVQQRDRS